MSRVFFAATLTLLTSPLFVFAGDTIWNHQAAFGLKKDQWQNVKIKRASKVHLLKFRWTLYKKGALVMHVLYDKKSYQPLLYVSHRLNTFKVDLFSKPDNSSRVQYEIPYALIVFRAFDEKKKMAYFDFLIKDYGLGEIFYAEGKR